MSKKLYVGNVKWGATEEDLEKLFSEHGKVSSVKIISDKDTGRSRGFAFVEMEDGIDEAIQKLDGFEFMGRPLKVNEAKPKEGGGGGKRERSHHHHSRNDRE